MAILSSPAPGRWGGIDLGTGLPVVRDGQPASMNFVAHYAQIAFIVATAVVLIAGIVAYALVAYQCIKHGYSHVVAYGPNGWQFWNFRIVCSK